MSFVKIENGSVVQYPYSYRQLLFDNPSTSFPETMPNERLAEWGVFPVLSVTVPQINYTQNVQELNPEQIDGIWTQKWEVTNASQEEKDQRLADQWASVRAERNNLLYQSDWTQLPDAPVNAQTWATYRQQLRDITLQQDPYNITWPTTPV